MNNQTTELLFDILSSVICGKPLSEEKKKTITGEIIKELFMLATKHDIAHLIGIELLNSRIITKESVYYNRINQLTATAVLRYERTNYDLLNFCEAFEKASIPFIPLKGAVVRKYYPEPWMRTSCDIDVLVREADLERAISVLETELQYIKDEKRNYHDVSLHSKSGSHLELHFSIKENMASIDNVLDKVWQYAVVSKDKQYQYELTNEFLLFHIISHMSYHFVTGGCGIRPFIDLLLTESTLSINQEEFFALLRETKLEKFYENIKLLITVWFVNGNHTDTTKQMENYILLGGVYGTLQNKVILQQQKKKGKYSYLLQRIFVPYDKIEYLYPVVKRHHWLFPFMQVRRWFDVAFDGRAKRAAKELSYNQNVSKSESNAMRQFLDEIGL